LFGLGVLVLFARRLGGNWIVDALVPPGSERPAAHAAWTIGTSLLYAIAIAMVIYGIALVVAAWLAGPTRPAVAVRRALAPWLRDHVVAVYGVVGTLFLLVLLWGPTPATHKLIGIVVLAALTVLGVEALRRQTAREFPDAVEGQTMLGIRAWASAGRRARRVHGDGQT
jgi:cytochrome b561